MEQENFEHEIRVTKYNVEGFRLEAQHTAFIINDMLQNYLVDHHYYYAKVNPKFNAMVDAAMNAVWDAYQALQEENETFDHLPNAPKAPVTEQTAHTPDLENAPAKHRMNSEEILATITQSQPSIQGLKEFIELAMEQQGVDITIVIKAFFPDTVTIDQLALTKTLQELEQFGLVHVSYAFHDVDTNQKIRIHQDQYMHALENDFNDYLHPQTQVLVEQDLARDCLKTSVEMTQNFREMFN